MKVNYLLILCIVSVFPSWVTADIYRYIDKNGVMHFTNTPTSSRYSIYINSKAFDYNFSKQYDGLIVEAAEKHGVSFPLVKAIIKVESGFNPRAVSRKGAKGLMQIMPETSKFLNVKNPFDPYENIMGGTRYLKDLLARFNGDMRLALAGYNAGPTKVEQYNGIPPFEETQDYVRDVIRYYRFLSSENK